MTKRLFTFAAFTLFLTGLSLPVYAESANYYIRQQESSDPGYQSAIRGSSYPDTYRSANYYNSSKRSYSYRSYDNSDEIIGTLRKGNCRYTVYSTGVSEYVTKSCD